MAHFLDRWSRWEFPRKHRDASGGDPKVSCDFAAASSRWVQVFAASMNMFNKGIVSMVISKGQKGLLFSKLGPQVL